MARHPLTVAAGVEAQVLPSKGSMDGGFAWPLLRRWPGIRVERTGDACASVLGGCPSVWMWLACCEGTCLGIIGGRWGRAHHGPRRMVAWPVRWGACRLCSPTCASCCTRRRARTPRRRSAPGQLRCGASLRPPNCRKMDGARRMAVHAGWRPRVGAHRADPAPAALEDVVLAIGDDLPAEPARHAECFLPEEAVETLRGTPSAGRPRWSSR